MTASSNHRPWMAVCLGASLLAGNLLAYVHLRSSEASTRAAAANLADCQAIADEICRLRRQPAKVTLQAHSATELSSQVEEALRFAQVSRNCLIRVDPQPARRLSATDFKEQPTALELRAVTLKQLIQFLHKLESGGGGLQTKSLQLAAPSKSPPGAAAETWNAQVTLTSLIFAPKNAPPS